MSEPASQRGQDRSQADSQGEERGGAATESASRASQRGGGVTLGPMRWWHIDAAAALDAELFAEEQWSLPMIWNELAQDESRHYLAAFDAGELIGYAGLAVFGDEASIQTIGVRASHQRRGVGAALLEALLAEADRRGVSGVFLEVAADNEPAKRLYARHGFAPLRVRRRYYRASGKDAIEMRRAR